MVLFPADSLTQREALRQLGNQFAITRLALAVFFKAVVVGLIVFQEDDTAGILIPEQGNRLVGFLLQVPKTDDIAKGLN